MKAILSISIHIIIGLSFQCWNSLQAQDTKLIVQTGHSSTVTDLCYHSVKNILASAGNDGRVILWDLNSGKQLNYFEQHDLPVNRILFYKDWLISGGEDGKLIIFDINSNRFIYQTVLPFPVHALEIHQGTGDLWIGGRKILLLKLNNFSIQELSGYSIPSGYYNDFSYNGAKNYMAVSIKGSNSIKIFDQNNNVVKRYKFQASSLAFDSTGKNLFASGNSGKLRKYEIDKSIFKRYSIPSRKWIDGYLSVRYIPEKGLFAGGNRNGKIQVHKINGGGIKWILDGHTGPVRALEISPDHKFLFSAGDDRIINIWDLEDGSCVKLAGLGSVINTIKIKSDKIYTGDEEGNCRQIDCFPDVPVKSAKIPLRNLEKRFGWRVRASEISPLSDKVILVHATKFKEVRNKNGFYNRSKNQFYLWNLSTNSYKPLKKNWQYGEVQGQYYAIDKNGTSIYEANFTGSSLEIKTSKKLSNTLGKNYTLISDENSGSLIIETKKDTFFLDPSSAALVKITNYIANRNQIQIRNKNISSDFKIPFEYKAFTVWENKELIAVTGDDAIIHFYDAAGNEKIKLVPVGEHDKILITPENNYSASKGALKGVGFSRLNRYYSFEQFDLFYNRPDLVYNILNQNDTLVNELKLAYEKRLSKLGISKDELKPDFSKIPELNIDEDKMVKSTRSAHLPVSFEASSPTSNLKEVQILINGVPQNIILNNEEKKIAGNIELELSAGLNTIQISAINDEGMESFIREYSVMCRKKTSKPNLYLVTLGASEYAQKENNLKYAQKDARDIDKVFKKDKSFNHVYSKTFVNQEISRATLKEIESFISGAGVDDIVIVCYSGHGVLDHHLDYYLATYNMDFLNPEKEGILYTEIEALMSKTKSRKKVLLLDACHSGEFDKEEVELTTEKKVEEGMITFRNGEENLKKKSAFNGKTTFELSRMLFADLADKNGAYVISSAGGAEFAMEGDSWKNGLFTYILLKGLTSGDADLNHDKSIMISELQRYIFAQVKELSQGRQVPTSRVSNLNSDFKIW